MKKYIVYYHADGGQMCVRGIRYFDNYKEAKQFVDYENNDRTHYCGKVANLFRCKEIGQNIGLQYPLIANIGRIK